MIDAHIRYDVHIGMDTYTFDNARDALTFARMAMFGDTTRVHCTITIRKETHDEETEH